MPQALGLAFLTDSLEPSWGGSTEGSAVPGCSILYHGARGPGREGAGDTAPWPQEAAPVAWLDPSVNGWPLEWKTWKGHVPFPEDPAQRPPPEGNVPIPSDLPHSCQK